MHAYSDNQPNQLLPTIEISGLCLHVPYDSLEVLMVMCGFLLKNVMIPGLSITQREQLSSLKNVLREIGFPFHRIVTFTYLRASPMVSLFI